MMVPRAAKVEEKEEEEEEEEEEESQVCVQRVATAASQTLPSSPSLAGIRLTMLMQKRAAFVVYRSCVVRILTLMMMIIFLKSMSLHLLYVRISRSRKKWYSY